MNKLILRDLNDYRTYHQPYYRRYTKDDISKYLRYPDRYEKQLRRAIRYIYGASPHFRRLITYFTGLSDLAYVVSPYRIDPTTANQKTVARNYRKTLNTLSAMGIQSQFPKILSVCLREDVFYGTMHESSDSITIQQLPPDYCNISTVENNVPNVTFDFSYFDSHRYYLKFYPQEFETKYNLYRGTGSILNKGMRYQELDAPTSFAIKCSQDILSYPLPPFAGILREVFELEDYKALKLTKTELANYAMIVMKLALNSDGDYALDYDKAYKFWHNLDSVLPEEIGSILTPMDVEKISFERTHTGDTDTIAEAEQNLFTAAGVSSSLFNNDKASANALLLSVKADQSITFSIVKSIGEMVNRYIQSKSYGKYFKVTFLDCSPYNRKELGDQYLKACQYGLPLISAYAATQGLSQGELDAMSFLETDILHLADTFKPLQSSATMSSSEADPDSPTDGEAGRPTKGIGEISESGEQNQEDA